MKVLLIGSGGREHAILWKLAQNSRIEKIFVCPGNSGMALEEKCQCINLNTNEEILNFAKMEDINLTVVGPEKPLCEGIVDLFKKNNLKIFGPSKKGAMLEGSKVYAKDFMKKYGIKTAEYATFKEKNKALEYIKKASYPLVIKADGLAAGKGVVICGSEVEAIETLEDFMAKDIFKGAGNEIVVEEFLEGIEASILSITDGETIIPFISSKDHKQLLDGDEGPNTGGMGGIAPNPYCTKEVLEDFKENIMEPTLRGIKEERLDFIGIIFFGIMITKKGTYLLEYNVRMGDPETECILPLMESDLLELIEYALEKQLKDKNILWKNSSTCTIIAASEGYPKAYAKGFKIETDKDMQGKIFYAGVKSSEDGILTNGGRVLALVEIGDTLEEATQKAYREISKINFNGIYFRKDIGKI
ncbi:phosphoribosylamine--glycine ligase [Hathewaya histolytica]|uniref:phosphoribosylamine--glycine ligase n=1 Tax=Hathewaya histolytica TaxID=1498 RepID=UPI003B67B817